MRHAIINQFVCRITFLLFLASAHPSYSQSLNVDMTGSDIGSFLTPVKLDTFYIGQPYNYIINPQNITGNLTWEVTASLSQNSGLKMQVNSTDLTGTITVTPDGTIENIVFVSSGVDANPNLSGYPIELTASDSLNAVNLTLRLPVSRAPVSVVFVLDRSGSMGWPPHGGSGTISRMDILQTAASLFINKLEAFSIPDDEVALTYFESTIDSPPAGFGASLTPISVNAVNFTNDIDSQAPGTATAMGGGLLAGKTKLASGAPFNRKFIFLFTDGEQNVSPMVNSAGTEAGTESLNNTEKSIQIVTIGTGAAAVMAPALLLQSIAEMNTGEDPPTAGTPRYFLLQEEVASDIDFNTMTGVSDFFDTGFQDMLTGSSPQTVGVEQGTVAPEEISTQEFMINANIDLILFELITSDQEPYFTIEKEGTQLTTRNSSLRYIHGPNNGTNSLLAILNLAGKPDPGITSEGKWTVNIMTGTSGSKAYQMKAQVDDHLLNYNFEVVAPDFKVEDTLQFITNINYTGIPIEDASITALVLKPGEDLGDLLARANVDFETSDSQESGSVGYQKLLAAIENNAAIIDSLGLQENSVNLTHSGNGKYEAEFPNTDVTGVYQVIARISGNNHSIGTYQRLVRRTVYLRFGDPDPDISDQQHDPVDDSTVVINYTPMYQAAGKMRFVGPGFGQGIEVEGKGIKIREVQDHGDGSYSITLTGNPDAEIDLSLGGVLVYSGPADGEEGFCDWVKNVLGIPCWLAILILIVIIIIIIAIRRKSGSS